MLGRAFGDFVLKEKIGAGGGGDVYAAMQLTLERACVVKVVEGDGKRDTAAAQAFLREARIASTLDHPFAAHIYDFGSEDDGTLWVAMELVRGEPLSRVIERQGSVPLAQFVPFFDRVCEVLHQAHQQGIVHRDIKPQNIMVIGRAGRLLPKLLDFGLASTGGQSSGKIAGTPHFMPPEQWRKEGPVDARSDIYSLALTAYEAIAGHKAFSDANTIFTLAQAHANRAVPPLPDTLPAALYDVLALATAKKPEFRYATAIELATAFRAASGLEAEPMPLPQLDRSVLENVTAEAPQPIAEAVAVLEVARNARQQVISALTVRRVIYRYLAVTALASRVRVGPGSGSDHASVVSLVQKLAAKSLLDDEWLALARALTQPFAATAEMYPVPELIAACQSDFSELDAAANAPAPANEEAAYAIATKLVPLISTALQRLSFIFDYALVVRRDRWMGTRRQQRAEQTPLLADTAHPSLVDRSGAVVLDLFPFLQVFSPSAGAPDEAFLLDGAGRHGAKLLALPTPFERQSEEVWSTLAAVGLDVRESQARANEEKAPYKGLATFTADDADNFFGREKEAEAFANRLHNTPFLTVVGPSGAGKSSFVLAGVLPLLGDAWQTAVMRPGGSPLSTLSARLERIDPSKRLFLVIDQFEELVTQCLDPVEREAFAAKLMALAYADHCRVVVTVRDDFLIRIQQVPSLRERLSSSLQLLGTPAEDDLLRVLIEPAARAGYAFDDAGLPKEMVSAVLDNPGALALLSFTASQMWDRRDRHLHQLQAKTYRALGGVGGALGYHAEQTMLAMSAEEQALVRDAFRRLVTAEGTRALMSRAEMRQVLGATPTADSVIDKLVNARLLVTSETEKEDRVEVIHEALLRSWPRLVQWQREEAETARLRDALRSSARQWLERDQARGLLWRDEALAEYKVWRARFAGRLTQTEEAFARASVAEEKRAQRLRRGLSAGAFAILIVALVVIFNAYRESQQRYVTMREEQARLALLGQKPYEALAYLNDAIDYGADTAAVREMGGLVQWLLQSDRGVLLAHKEAIQSINYDRASDVGVSFTKDEAFLWSVKQGTPKKLPTPVGCFASTWASNAKTLVALCFDQKLRVFEASSGTLRHETVIGETRMFNLAPSPFADEVLVLGQSGHVFRFNVETHAITEVQGVPKEPFFYINSTQGVAPLFVAFHGAYDLTSDTLTGFTLGAYGGAVRRVPTDSPVMQAVFDKSGERIALATADGSVAMYHVKEARWLWKTKKHSAAISVMGFSDHNQLLTGSADHWVRIWDVTGREVAASELASEVTCAAWGKGDTFVAGGAAGELHSVDIATSQVLWRHASIGDRATQCFITADDQTLVDAEGNALRMRDPSVRYGINITRPEPILSVTFDSGHPSSVMLATRTALERVSLTSQQAEPVMSLTHNKEQLLLLHSFARGALLVDGMRLSLFLNDGTQRDLTSTQAFRPYVISDPQGARIAGQIEDHPDIALFTVGASGLIATKPLRSPEGALLVNGVFVGDDNLVTCSDSGVVRLWSLQTAAVLDEQVAHGAPCWVERFSEGVRSIGYDNATHIWRVAEGKLVRGTTYRIPPLTELISDDFRSSISLSGTFSIRGSNALPQWQTELVPGGIQSGGQQGVQLAALGVNGSVMIVARPKETSLEATRTFAKERGRLIITDGRLEPR